MVLQMNKYNNKTFLVSGATGLIGKTIVKHLLETDANIICSVRNIEKAKTIFGDTDRIIYIIGDIQTLPIEDRRVNYIIHAAAETSSKAFINKPVDIIETSFFGTKRILDFALKNHVESIVYLSSMEVYGAPVTDDKIVESSGTTLNTMDVRSSYPESKRICESLCRAYTAQYDLPVKTVRLTQTFGEGVQYNDPRVFAEFARCAIEKKDIILHSSGETKRNYLYTQDAVSAILTVLIEGKDGEAYNAANESTYCSIIEMANMVAKECANNEIDVIIENKENISEYGYAPILKMNLSTAKLQQLGWYPTTSLKEMFTRLIADMQHNR